jgi:hypothetical protein
MANHSNPSKSTHAYTLTLADASQKRRNDSSNALFEPRKSNRVATRIPADVITEAGVTMAGTIVVLSDTGMQLECSRQTMDCLQTGLLRFIRCKPAKIKPCFSLPGNVVPFDPVKVQCETVYARKTKHDSSRIDMKFPVFNEGEETLAEYLSFRAAIDYPHTSTASQRIYNHDFNIPVTP